ncbi:MAG: NapC/NirT family cytochrome c [Acidobacteria bacterium]|nr:NapC/NirT family cytochrome c [Acidobacteriota bacterium]
MHKTVPILLALVAGGVSFALAADAPKAGEAAIGTIPYDRFERPKVCATCHVDISRQHEQAMMSQAYTHSWDEIEYFQLAVPHAEIEPKVAGVKAGCNGCHAPIALLAGDVPPPEPAEGSRANESVSCDLCHSVVGFEGDTPYNFNWISSPGKVKQGPRPGRVSPHHETVENPFLRTADFCGTCHNEMSPYGTWVKSTHLEWREGPHGRAGIVCQDCHMPPAEGKSATMGEPLPDMRQHLFHGAHDPGKLAGVVEVRIHPVDREVEPGDRVRLVAVVVNAKAGHKVPTGSVEDRLLWLDVEAVDSLGRSHHLSVDPKGFPGEEYTIASDTALAYQDIGPIEKATDFPGLLRDAPVPAGDRIFRLPYLDPDGRMTIAQWHTASFGPDYRLAPLEARTETFTWTVPDDLPEGEITVTARIWYSRLVASVAEHLGVPREEWEPVAINRHQTRIVVVD